MITIDGTAVFEQNNDENIIHRCATRRVAQILATALELRASGWAIAWPSSQHRFRRPLLLPGERMREPLDGTRSDERAQGFTAHRGNDCLTVDACAGLPPLVLAEHGDTTDARRIVEWHLGTLS